MVARACTLLTSLLTFLVLGIIIVTNHFLFLTTYPLPFEDMSTPHGRKRRPANPTAHQDRQVRGQRCSDWDTFHSANPHKQKIQPTPLLLLLAQPSSNPRVSGSCRFNPRHTFQPQPNCHLVNNLFSILFLRSVSTWANGLCVLAMLQVNGVAPLGSTVQLSLCQWVRQGSWPHIYLVIVCTGATGGHCRGNWTHSPQ